VPSDDGFGFDDDERIGPAAPEATEDGPEEAVTTIHPWARALAFEDGDLLAESQDFQGGIRSGLKENAEAG
jgi:hypothetical protein